MPNYKSHRRLPEIVLFLPALLLTPAACFAHPMGNFSVNHYAKI